MPRGFGPRRRVVVHVCLALGNDRVGEAFDVISVGVDFFPLFLGLLLELFLLEIIDYFVSALLLNHRQNVLVLHVVHGLGQFALGLLEGQLVRSTLLQIVDKEENKAQQTNAHECKACGQDQIRARGDFYEGAPCSREEL